MLSYLKPVVDAAGDVRLEQRKSNVGMHGLATLGHLGVDETKHGLVAGKCGGLVARLFLQLDG